MPRLLVADCSEFWRRFERSPLRREEVEIVLARSASEVARRARAEHFDAVVLDVGTPEAQDLARELGSASGPGACRVLPPSIVDEAETACGLGLECRRQPRSRRPLRVTAEGPARFEALTRDASPAGMFLPGAPALAVGTLLEARVRPPGAREEARVRMRVARSVEEPEDSHRMSGLGVRLEPGSEADRELLERWLTPEEGEA